MGGFTRGRLVHSENLFPRLMYDAYIDEHYNTTLGVYHIHRLVRGGEDGMHIYDA